MCSSDLSTAAYVYSTSQSAVQVTYVDATTAVVYTNDFTNPRTQQLNEWVYQGGQISPYVPAPTPRPGPPSFISLVPAAQQSVAVGGNITNWQVQGASSLTTDGTYVTLNPFRTYQISFTIGVWYFTTPNEYMVFGAVDENGDQIGRAHV